MPIISLIVAAAHDGVIGREGGMPWHLPADLRHFKALTLGKPVLMGRKTLQSIGRPLPGRRNIVISRDQGFRPHGVETARSLDEAIRMAGEGCGEIMVIGGGEIYRAALPLARRIYLTEIDMAVTGDTHFPDLPRPLWREAARQDFPAADGRPGYSFVLLERD